MSNINLEQIDLIMQRANVTYNEAKEALEACNGDIVEALLYLEKADKIKKAPASHNCDSFKSFIGKLNATRFILHKGERTYMDIPLTIAILAIILCCHISIVALVIALILGVKINIKGENDIAQKFSSAVNSFQK